MMSTDSSGETQAIRHNLVDEATKFLVNPNVSKHTVDQKSSFLRKKGLSEAEIAAAYSKASTYVAPQPVGQSGDPRGGGEGAMVPYSISGPLTLPPPPTAWMRVRDVCNVILVLSGASYGLYKLYLKFVRPWLTGRREKTVEESMIELQQSVVTVLKEVQATLDSLQLTLSAQSAHIQALGSKDNQGAAVTPKQLTEIKQEIASLKGLMIGKRTFPSTPGLSPAIPSWQLNRSSGKPMDATHQSHNVLSTASEVSESGELLATGSEVQEDEVTYSLQDTETQALKTPQLENGDARRENGDARHENGDVGACGSGGGAEDQYDSDSEDRSV